MLTVSNIHFNIANKPILSDVSFTLQRGEVVGFVGDNGSGKTTTLSIISGCMRPNAGTISFREHSIWDNLREYHANMGYVPDRIPLYRNASVFENLLYSAELKGILNPTSRVHATLEELHLRTIEHQPVRTLSKGWTQWVGIAQAWIAKPQLLLLDEPTSGLDPSGRQRFMAWINNIRTEGHTVFFSSHILSEVESVCDRVLWLDKGQLINKNTPSTIQMLCSLDKLNDLQTLIETLSAIDGVQQVKTTTQGLSVQCTEPARTTLAKELIPYGLLEFRKQA